MGSGQETNRRTFLKGGLAGAAACALGAERAPAESGVARGRRRSRGKPRNIIFMVSDGMSMGVPTMAEAFSRLVRGRGTRWYGLQNRADAFLGWFETYALNTMVTDSAAATTAWASGSRVHNGSLNVLPDGTRLTPIGRLMREVGRGVGLVSTTTITHATPAGFVAVHPERDAQGEIAVQYLDRVDVLLGGGLEYFGADARSDGRDLFVDYAREGYAVVRDRRGLCERRGDDRLLGVFDRGHLPYSIDWRNDGSLSERVPTLAEMTEAALRVLRRKDGGFLLQVEGGRVDHAAHANDAAALMWEQLAFDDALGVVLGFAAEHPDTLVIVTSDHGNANPGLNGMGARYADTNACFARLAEATASYVTLLGRLKAQQERGVLTEDALGRSVFEATGVGLDGGEVAALAAHVREEPREELSHQHRNLVGALGQVLGNHTGVGWTGVSHTSDLVPIAAIGPGSERFAGLLRNVEAFGHLTELVGLAHRNPQAKSEQTARGRTAEEVLFHA